MLAKRYQLVVAQAGHAASAMLIRWYLQNKDRISMPRMYTLSHLSRLINERDCVQIKRVEESHSVNRKMKDNGTYPTCRNESKLVKISLKDLAEVLHYLAQFSAHCKERLWYNR